MAAAEEQESKTTADSNLTPQQRESLDVFLQELQDDAENVRVAAMERFLQTDTTMLAAASEFLVAPLLLALRRSAYTNEASRAAVNLLVKMGKPAAQELLKLAEDTNYYTVHGACILLARMGDPDQAPGARATLGADIKGSNEYRARAAIDAMVAIGDEYVVDFLMLDVLPTHRNVLVRAAAARGLGLIGDKRAIPALTKALRDPDPYNVRPQASDALEKLR